MTSGFILHDVPEKIARKRLALIQLTKEQLREYLRLPEGVDILKVRDCADHMDRFGEGTIQIKITGDCCPLVPEGDLIAIDALDTYQRQGET